MPSSSLHHTRLILTYFLTLAYLPEGTLTRATLTPGKKEKPKRIIKQRQSIAERPRGTTMFPISRVKKIIKADGELDMMTSEATFLIAVATVRFLLDSMEEHS